MLAGGGFEEPTMPFASFSGGGDNAAKQQKIAQLYKIPEEIMFFGSYDEVRVLLHLPPAAS